MKVAIRFKKDNYVFDCKQLRVLEDYRHYIGIDDRAYRIDNHELLADALKDERIKVFDRDYCAFCFDDYRYILGPFVDSDSLIAKDIVDTINLSVFEQFKQNKELIKLDLEEILGGIEEFVDRYSIGDIRFERD